MENEKKDRYGMLGDLIASIGIPKEQTSILKDVGKTGYKIATTKNGDFDRAAMLADFIARYYGQNHPGSLLGNVRYDQTDWGAPVLKYEWRF